MMAEQPGQASHLHVTKGWDVLVDRIIQANFALLQVDSYSIRTLAQDSTWASSWHFMPGIDRSEVSTHVMPGSFEPAFAEIKS